MKRLIVTADDFGAAPEVNEAVETAHRHGILSASSLMVSGAAASDAVARARRMPRLRVGLHLVLVEGRPTLPAPRVSRLVGADGRFRSDMAGLGATIAASPRARRQLAAEITAQLERYLATGLALDHCNAHKHFHLHPVIGRMMAAICRRFGVRAVRVPEEPHSVLRMIDPSTSRVPSLLIAPFTRLLRRQVRAAGLATSDRVFGLRWSGGMTQERLGALIDHLPQGLSEIYLHPATGPYAGSAPGYRYREEMEALLSPRVAGALRNEAVRLGGFTDFCGPPTLAADPGTSEITRTGAGPGIAGGVSMP